MSLRIGFSIYKTRRNSAGKILGDYDDNIYVNAMSAGNVVGKMMEDPSVVSCIVNRVQIEVKDKS